MDLRAFTVWQPWASLIVGGWKRYEFRGWPAPKFIIGKRIVIHAGARPVRRKEVADLLWELTSGNFCGGLNSDCVPFLEDVLMDRRKLPLSAGLGTAILGVPKRSHELWPDEFKGYSDSDREQVSNWAWPMEEVQPFTPIVPTPGRQGLWKWPWSGAAQ